MAFRMNVDRLNRDELEYELKVRGISESGNVDKLRKTLRGVLLLEKSGSSVSSYIALDVKNELTVCEQKLNEISTLLGTFTLSSSDSDFIKTETKFAHLFARVDRIQTDDQTLIDKRAVVFSTLMELVSDYQSKRQEFSTAPPYTEFYSDPTATVSCNTSNLNNSVTVDPSNVFKSVPTYKWNLKFSGNPNDGLSFNAFLERVEEYCKSRKVDKTQLFDSATDLFEGEALLWFRLVKRQVNDWDGLINLMKQEFMPSYRTDKLWDQILKRTQGSDESIGIYVAVMTSLFDRMPTSVPDPLRLRVLRSNILPFYQEKLVLVDIKTPYELIQYCRKLEEAKEKINEYKPPIKGQLSLEPDLDYSHSISKFAPQVKVRELTASNSPQQLCFRCNKPGHIARNCTVRTQLKCFSCGKLNFTKNTCPSCNRSGNGSRRQS